MNKRGYNLRLIEKLFVLITEAYGCGFSQKQMAGMMYILDRIYSRETGRHVLSVPCGIGKSTVIKIMIAYNIIMKIPTLIITDRLERLKEYMSDKKLREFVQKICNEDRYKTDVVNLSTDTDVQLYQVSDKVIVLLSLQKYNGLSNEQRSLLYNCNATEEESRTIIIDEALISHDTVQINNGVLGRMGGTIRDAVARLDNNYEDLQNVIEVFSELTSYLQDEMLRLEHLAENVVIPYVPQRKGFTGKGNDSEEEQLFLKTIQKNMDTFMNMDSEFKKDFEALSNILNKKVPFL